MPVDLEVLLQHFNAAAEFRQELGSVSDGSLQPQ